MNAMNSARYQPHPRPTPTQRQWPDASLKTAPRWSSSDLRDGNQALFEPMSNAHKLQLFERLCAIGLREIEVGFPAAAAAEFAFVRQLISEGRIPDTVRIAVLTPARHDLIALTLQALTGAARATVHLYHAIADDFREQVFAIDRATLSERIVASVTAIREHAERHPETSWCLQFSPEHFSSSDPAYALQVCDAVSLAWQADDARPLIINLPATVECCMPHVYADLIEYMHRHLARRQHLTLSVHPHNDRGCAVAAAELAVLAGAERVEGCLFGHGERTGNVDLVTLALNLHSQGVAPGLDFGALDSLVHLVQTCTGLPVHPRHPYAGDLVYTAFSGSHQDAIRKGLQQQQPEAVWRVPYLPIDPGDVGRDYNGLVRLNSQSGKGGVAYLLEQRGVRLSRRHLIDFSARVKTLSDGSGEVSAEQLWQFFLACYASDAHRQPWQLHSFELSADGQSIDLQMHHADRSVHLSGHGCGTLDAAVAALPRRLEVVAYSEFSLTCGSTAEALAVIEGQGDGLPFFAVGVAANRILATLLALCSALNQSESAHQPG